MARPKLTPEEKERRKFERKAAAMNAAERKAHGPLFADLAPVHTAEEAYRNWRLTKGGRHWDVTHPFHDAYRWIVLRRIEALVLAAAGPDLGAELVAHVRDVFRHNVQYMGPHWKGVLTGRTRMTFRYRLAFDPAHANAVNTDGRHLLSDEWPGPDFVPAITAEEWDRRFPDIRPEPDGPAVGDEERMAAVLATLGRGSTTAGST